LIGGPGPPGPTRWLRPSERPQKTSPDRKNQASHAGNRKKKLIIDGFLVKFASSKIRILKSFRSKKGLKTFLVLRPQFFQILKTVQGQDLKKMVLRPVLRTTSLIVPKSFSNLECFVQKFPP